MAGFSGQLSVAHYRKSVLMITVYSKPRCVQCDATKRALNAKGLVEAVDYTIIDVMEDAEAHARIVALGYRQVPVVVVGETHWSGFNPDMISKL